MKTDEVRSIVFSYKIKKQETNAILKKFFSKKGANIYFFTINFPIKTVNAYVSHFNFIKIINLHHFYFAIIFKLDHNIHIREENYKCAAIQKS